MANMGSNIEGQMTVAILIESLSQETEYSTEIASRSILTGEKATWGYVSMTLIKEQNKTLTDAKSMLAATQCNCLKLAPTQTGEERSDGLKRKQL